MNIGEIFIKLGLKSDDADKKAEKSKKNLKGVGSEALAAKAAIVGAMYALQRLFSTSGQAGTNLTNFNAALGMSTKTLQQYQYAARQVGVSNEAVENTFKGLQQAMTKTLMGEGAPKGLARVALMTGDIMPEDILKFQEHPEELLKKLQEYAQKETNIGMRNEVLKSFGVGDDMIAALSRNAFTPGQLAKAPTYSDSEIKSLDKANIAWSNLGNTIEMAVGRFNAKYGTQLVEDIGKIVDKVLELSVSFTKLAEKLELFKTIGEVFKGWTLIFDGLNEAVGTFTGVMDDPKKREAFKGKMSDFFTGESAPANAVALKETMDSYSPTAIPLNILKSAFNKMVPEVSPKEKMNSIMMQKRLTESGYYGVPEAPGVSGSPGAPGDTPSPNVGVAPMMPKVNPVNPVSSSLVQTTNNTNQPHQINVQQTLNFDKNPGTNPVRVQDVHKKALQDAYRQISAQGQGS